MQQLTAETRVTCKLQLAGQKWSANLVRLRAHLLAHGGRYPRDSCTDDVERKLGGWVRRQRPTPPALYLCYA